MVQMMALRMTDRDFRNYRNKVRRQRNIRKKCTILIYSLCLTIGLSISYHAFTSDANTDSEKALYKYFTCIMVEYGDNLWSIAQNYQGENYASTNDYVNEVMRINHLTDEDIRAGQYLVVPYYSEDFK